MSTSTRRTSAAATVSRDERVAKRPRTPQANSWSARQSASAPAHVLHREAGDEAGADQHTGRRNPEQPSVGTVVDGGARAGHHPEQPRDRRAQLPGQLNIRPRSRRPRPLDSGHHDLVSKVWYVEHAWLRQASQAQKYSRVAG